MLSKIEGIKNDFRIPPRCQLFEFGDLGWVPGLFQDLMRDILGDIAERGVYDPIFPILSDLIKKHKCSNIIDLCTGSGIPAMLLREYLQKAGYLTNLVLTDKFPHKSRAKAINSQVTPVKYLTESIDATTLPTELKGLRTLFASMHHFKPEQVQAILQNAMDNNQPIATIEFTERNWTRVFFMIVGTLHALAITPFIKPFSFSRLFWTYLIPVVPVIYFWDGLVSNLRTYSKEDLEKIIAQLKDNRFDWEIKTMPTLVRPINLTYLIGQPKNGENPTILSKQASSERPMIKSGHKTSFSAYIALGLLSGFCIFLMRPNVNLALAICFLATLLCGLAVSPAKTKLSQYGRFFQPSTVETFDESLDAGSEIKAS